VSSPDESLSTSRPCVRLLLLAVRTPIPVYLVIYDSGKVSLEHLLLSWYPSGGVVQIRQLWKGDGPSVTKLERPDESLSTFRAFARLLLNQILTVLESKEGCARGTGYARNRFVARSVRQGWPSVLSIAVLGVWCFRPWARLLLLAVRTTTLQECAVVPRRARIEGS